MSDWEQHQEIEIGRIKDRIKDIDVITTLHLMHNGHPYTEYVCQLEFPHPTREETVKLARIDKSHGFLHIDKLWQKENGKERIYEELDLWDAARKLEGNWKNYFRKWANREDTETSELMNAEDV